MATIQEVRQQLDTQKSQLQQAQQQSQNQLRQLQQAESKIPQFQSQTALRQTYPGVGGTVKRGMFQKIKEMVTGQKQKIKSYQGDINQSQQQLQQYEQTKLAPAEKQLRDYQIKQVAFNKAKKYYQSKVPVQFVKDDLVKDYLKQMLYENQQAQQSFKKYVSDFKKSNTGEKLLVDWENLNIKGVESPELQKSFTVPEYNKAISTFNYPELQIQSLPQQNINVPLSNVLLPSQPNNILQRLQNIANSYNPKTQTYTDIKGNQYSMSPLQVVQLQARLNSPQYTVPTSDIGESYSSQLRGFVSESSEPKGTAIIRQPTMQERAEIERANTRGNYLDRSSKEIIKQNKEYKNILEKINNQGYIEQEDINNLNNMGAVVKKNLDEDANIVYDISPPTVGVGLIWKKQIPISDLDVKTQTGLYFSAGRREFKDSLNYLANEIIPEKYKEFTTKGKYRVPKYGTTIIDPLTGKEVVEYEYFEQKTNIPDVIGNIGEIGSGIITFGPETTLKLGEEIYSQKDSTTPFRQGGAFGKGTFEFVKDYPLESIGVVTAGMLQGGSIIKNKLITKTIQNKIKELEGIKLKSLNVIDEGKGKVIVEGLKESDGIAQRIRYEGLIKATENGYKFIPEGEGQIIITGITNPSTLVSQRLFTLGQGFKGGSKGTNINIGKIGKIDVLEEIGISSTIPNKESFLMTSKIGGKSEKEIYEDLLSSTMGITTNTKPIKELTIPVWEDNLYGLEPRSNLLFKLDKNMFLRFNKNEAGLILNIPKKIESTIGRKGGGIKSSEEFMDSLYKNNLKVISKEFMPTKIKIAYPKNKIVYPMQPELPSMVGGSGKLLLPYEGKNKYERTEEYGGLIMNPVTNVGMIKPSILAFNNLNSKFETKIKLNLINVPKFTNKLKIESINDIETKLISLPKSNTLELQLSPQRQNLGEAIALKLKSKQRTKQTTPQVTTTPTPTTTPPKPKINPKGYPFDFPPTTQRKKRKLIPKRTNRDEFIIPEVRVHGKFLPIGKFKDPLVAESVARKKVLSDLSASYQLKTSSGRLLIPKPSPLFRPSKRNPFISVQKKYKIPSLGYSGRLTSRGERKEIKNALKVSKIKW